MKYTREILQAAVDKSTSMAGVMRALGVSRPSGGLHAHLRRRVDAFGIDTSHFRRVHNKGERSPCRLESSDILVMRPDGSRRQKPELLRRALLDRGTKYVCGMCGLSDEWNARPLTLHVDHINGDILDCRSHNLRFLCPNCHSQTSNYAGRNRDMWRSGQDRARVMARDRVIIEAALESPAAGAIALSKSHPEVARACGRETVRRILQRVGLGTQTVRGVAASGSMWAGEGPPLWARPTLTALRECLGAVLEKRTTAGRHTRP